MEENPGLGASRRSCCVVYSNIRGLHKNFSDLSHCQRWRHCFFVLRLLSFPCAIFRSWFRVLVDRCSCSRVRLIGSEGWALYVRDGFPSYRRRSMSVDGVNS